MKRNLNWIYLICVTFLSSCDSTRLFEKDETLANEEWVVSNPLEFDFEINQHKVPCNILINVRNGIEYPYQNLYFNYSLATSDGDTLAQELINLQLFDSKTGKPLGVGLGNIYDIQQKVLSNFPFPKNGEYVIRLKQAMRSDTLQGVTSLGIRVEKAGR